MEQEIRTQALESIEESATELDANRQAATTQLFEELDGEEVVSKRDACVKHFNLGGGHFQAITYPEPVHYRERKGAPWVEIDNTLERKLTGNGRYVHRNRANSLKAEFADQVDGQNLVRLEHEGRSFSWQLDRPAKVVRASVKQGAELRKAELVAKVIGKPEILERIATKRGAVQAKSQKSGAETLEARQQKMRAAICEMELTELKSELLTPQERRSEIASTVAQAAYEGLLPGLSVRYTLKGDRLKEDIILENAAALDGAVLRLPGEYRYELREDQSLAVLSADDGELQFEFESPIGYDANYDSVPVTVRLEGAAGYTRLTYEIPEDALRAAAFPVTIDPVVKTKNSETDIKDYSLCEGASAVTSDGYITSGIKSGKRWVGLYKISKQYKYRAGDTVVQAYMRVVDHSANDGVYAGCYEILEPWTNASACWMSSPPTGKVNLNYDNTSVVSKYATDVIHGEAVLNTYVRIYLTSMFRKWCLVDSSNPSQSQNNGFMLHRPNNLTADHLVQLRSTGTTVTDAKPVFYVNYISHAGNAPWGQYESQSAGRAGTASVDLFNGNLVVSHTDTNMTGSRMPISVTHTYNSCTSDKNDYDCGYGWKTSAHQRLRKETLSGTDYRVWVDGSGTEHWFKISGSETYKDQEGLGLKLKTSNSTIEDKQHNVMTFSSSASESYRLKSIKDSVGNTATFAYYDGTNRLKSVTDPAGRVTTFFYNVDNLLSSITVPDRIGVKTTTFSYASGKLNYVTYHDGKTSTYTYEGGSNLLASIRNYDGTTLNIEYESESEFFFAGVSTDVINTSRCVKSLASMCNSMYGAKQQFEYRDMQTEVTTVENASGAAQGKKLIYQFNGAGNVVCIRDELGVAQFTKFDSGIANNPSDESKMRKVIANRLRSPDFAANWTNVGAHVTYGESVVTSNSENYCCMNVQSLLISHGIRNIEILSRQTVTIERGLNWTLSAYVKTPDVTNVNAYIRVVPTNGETTYTSTALTEKTPDALEGMPTSGWVRLQTTFNYAGSGVIDVNVELVSKAVNSSVYFGCPQLEEGICATRVNLISNNDFRYTIANGSRQFPLDWETMEDIDTNSRVGVQSSLDDSYYAMPTALSGKPLRLVGKASKYYVGFQQVINIAGKNKDSFILGGWACARSLPNKETGESGFRITIRFKKTDDTWADGIRCQFNPEWVGWQYAMIPVMANANYKAVRVQVMYAEEDNEACFANMFLHREEFGRAFVRDSDGDIMSETVRSGQQKKIERDDAKNIISYIKPGKTDADANKWCADYGSDKATRQKHLLSYSTTPTGLRKRYYYDNYGNAVGEAVYMKDTGSTSGEPIINSETVYDSKAMYAIKKIDSRSNAVTSIIDPNIGCLDSVTAPKPNTTTGTESVTVNYTYDSLERLTKAATSVDGKEYKNEYTYDANTGRMTSVKHNTTGTTSDVEYSFTYDDLGSPTEVKVGNTVLSTNIYENTPGEPKQYTREHKLSRTVFGNGNKVVNSYDAYDRLIGVKFDGDTVDRYVYEYGPDGQVGRVRDKTSGMERAYETEYDLADRPVRTTTRKDSTSDKSILYQATLDYDKCNRLTKFAEQVEGQQYLTSYRQEEAASSTNRTPSYDADDRLKEIRYMEPADMPKGTTAGTIRRKHTVTYDQLGRISKTTLMNSSNNRTTDYTYESGTLISSHAGNGKRSETTLIKTISNGVVNYSYTYDRAGNIKTETRGGVLTTYTYDGMGQLIRADDANEGASWKYEYDMGGNLTAMKKHAYTTGTLGAVTQTKTYAYGDTYWKDKLTSFNSVGITYDTIGNPLGDGTNTYTWEKGRQLKQIAKSGQTVAYKYNVAGLRVQKTVTGGTEAGTYDYHLHGKLLMHMKKTNGSAVDHLHFFYDHASRPILVKYGSVYYSYVHNLQGDIVAIVDASGAKVVEYKYDAWGRQTSVSGSMATTLGKLNPFRYRGYVYDEETKLYYLRSRYYNPEWGRFVNEDILLGKPGALMSHNMFAYCSNSPIGKIDGDGEWSFAVIFMIVTTVICNVLVGSAIFGGSQGASKGGSKKRASGSPPYSPEFKKKLQEKRRNDFFEKCSIRPKNYDLRYSFVARYPASAEMQEWFENYCRDVNWSYGDGGGKLYGHGGGKFSTLVYDRYNFKFANVTVERIQGSYKSAETWEDVMNAIGSVDWLPDTVQSGMTMLDVSDRLAGGGIANVTQAHSIIDYSWDYYCITGFKYQ